MLKLHIIAFLLLFLPFSLSAQTKIYIDPGHGGTDPGGRNVPLNTNESDRVLYTGLVLRDYLDADTANTSGGGSWQVRMSRTTDVNVGISARANDANSWGAALFVSIHQNAFNQSANGTETLHFPNSTNSIRLSQFIQEEAILAWGLRDRGLKPRSDLGVLNNTNMPATLTEMGFVDSPTDHPFCASDVQCSRYALGILYGLQRYQNLPKFDPGTVSSGVELIVDNDDASGYLETGGWTTSGFGTPNDATGRFVAAGASSTAQWNPNFTESGEYEVALWYVAGTNRSSAAHYTISHAGGSTVLLVDQSSNGQQWFPIGNFNFNSGQSGSVLLSAALSSDDGSASTVVIADGVRFRKVGEFFDGVIVDNDLGVGYQEIGDWATSLSSGFFETSSRFATPAVVGNQAIFTPTFDSAGQFEVSAWWVEGGNRSSSATYVINHAEGSTNVSVNQQQNGGQWNSLGTFNFRSGSSGNATLDSALSVSNGVGTVISSDAVRFERVGTYIEPSVMEDIWLLW